MPIFLRILGYLRPYRGSILIGLACLLLATPAGLFHPLVWRYVVDEVIGRRQVAMLVPALVAMTVVGMLGAALGAFRSNLLEKVGQRFTMELRNEAYRKLQGQSIAYLHDNRVGDLQSRVMSDIDVLQDVAIQGTDSVLANALSFLWVAGILIAINWRMGLATLVPMLFVAVLVWQFNLRVRALYRAARERMGDVGARLQENLVGMIVIKAFAREREEAARFRQATEEYLKVNVRAINARSVLFPSVQFVAFLSNVLAIGVGAWLVLQGQASVGDLVAYRGYWWQLFSPIQSLATVNDLVQRAAAAGRRVFELLDEPEAIVDAPDAVPLPRLDGRASGGAEVRFEGVTFSYRDRPALNDVTLAVAPGEMVALVGPSGSGKSTLLSLIPRFYDPQEGRIVVNGHDVRHVTQASLRRQIAMVLQETFLFNGTILDNLRYGRPDATEDEIEAATRAANAHDFIAALPDGYGTEIGERGVKLSGGQRQRISIARAFLTDPAILILDEATSAVEPESEWIIQQALDRLVCGRTTLLTSHRLSMVRTADRIAVLDEGRLVETGTHAELIGADGLYAAMYHRQMGEGWDSLPRAPEQEPSR
jgi:ABC-type multidrug transport system fused ATPase/permease subunit